jgi:sulfatase maturation enzyme AslB (radical SAM superfamily)
MSEEIAEWMLGNEVRLVTTLDGPAAIHDANLEWTGGAPHADVVRWLEYFARRYAELGRDPDEWRVEARCNTTRQALESIAEVLDEYTARGLRTIHLRPLDSARFDESKWQEIGYDHSQYLGLYGAALDAVIERNRAGADIAEGLAVALATKILSEDDPGIADVQSPCGFGTNLLAYDPAGQVFPCEEAQALNDAGDPTFLLGDVSGLSVTELVRHPTVRAIAAASLLDAHPMYATRWNKPFCGLNPVRNYIAQGDLFGQERFSLESKVLDRACTRLFELLVDDGDTAAREIVQRWATLRGPETIDRRATA